MEWCMIIHDQESLALPGLRKRLNRLGTASEKFLALQFASGPHRLWCHEVPCTEDFEESQTLPIQGTVGATTKAPRLRTKAAICHSDARTFKK